MFKSHFNFIKIFKCILVSLKYDFRARKEKIKNLIKLIKIIKYLCKPLKSHSES